MLVILTAALPAGTTQIKRTARFQPGTTRTDIYNSAVRETGLDRLRDGEFAITFFYAEPDEVTA
jgi:hypothetical protein